MLLGHLVFTEKDMANVLPVNKHFASVFTIENTQHLLTVRECFQGDDSDKLCSYDIARYGEE